MHKVCKQKYICFQQLNSLNQALVQAANIEKRENKIIADLSLVIPKAAAVVVSISGVDVTATVLV